MSEASTSAMDLLAHPPVLALLAFVGAGVAFAVAAWWWAGRAPA